MNLCPEAAKAQAIKASLTQEPVNARETFQPGLKNGRKISASEKQD